MGTKRIVFLTTALLAGGAETQLLQIAAGLAARGLRCTIVSLRPATSVGRLKALVDRAQRAGVEFQLGTGLMGMIKIGIQISPELVRHECILWTWGYRAELLRLVLFPFAQGSFSIRSASVSQAHRWRWLLRLGLPFTWRYISNSRLGVALVDQVAPGVAAKAEVVPNAVGTYLLESVGSRSCTRPSTLRVLMLGNVRFQVKGYDVALAVARRVRSAGLPIRIYIGGKQYDDERSLVDEIQKAGLEEIVTWAGPIANPAEFLGGGHAFMLLSRYEGMPNALFEAMASALPCVATDVGDLRCYAEESRAFRLVPIEDDEATFKELLWIWENWTDAVEMGLRAHRFCSLNFSEDRMIDGVMNALELVSSDATVV